MSKKALLIGSFAVAALAAVAQSGFYNNEPEVETPVTSLKECNAKVRKNSDRVLDAAESVGAQLDKAPILEIIEQYKDCALQFDGP